jgi:REP element-mobilizing transposase RayT
MREPPRFYQRNLPHWQPEGAIFAVSFRLAGSLPRHVVIALQQERDAKLAEVERLRAEWEKEHPDGLPLELIKQLEAARRKARDQYAGKFDEILDSNTYGPDWLRRPKIAKIVQGAMHYMEETLGRYRIIVYCIMPNHVHMVVDEVGPPLYQVLGSIKRYSGRIANQALGLTGKEFWHRESYDHIIRDGEEFRRQVAYVLANPVKAGLVDTWEAWPYTYLWEY